MFPSIDTVSKVGPPGLGLKKKKPELDQNFYLNNVSSNQKATFEIASVCPVRIAAGAHDFNCQTLTMAS